MRRVLDAVQRGQPLGAPVLLLVAVLVGAAVLGGVERYLLQRTAEGVVLATRARLAAHLLRLPVAEHDRRRTGDLLSRVGSDTTLLRAVVTCGLVEAASSVVIVRRRGRSRCCCSTPCCCSSRCSRWASGSGWCSRSPGGSGRCRPRRRRGSAT